MFDEYDEINLAVVQTEYELEKIRNEQKPEIVRTTQKSKPRWTWIILFLIGLMLFRIVGEILSF